MGEKTERYRPVAPFMVKFFKKVGDSIFLVSVFIYIWCYFAWESALVKGLKILGK